MRSLAVVAIIIACQRSEPRGSLPGAEPFEPELAQRIAAAANQPKPYTNRLILEPSPYLQQHAHDPVDWRPWGPDALAAAKRLDRPIFLSIGYSTCHWCHVMQHESFSDPEIAALINRGFVAIKVDREERPDLDRVYMAAVQRITGSGGWPMTVVLLPDGRPFFGGTYFPPRDGARGQGIGLVTLLDKLLVAYRERGDEVVATAQQLVEALQQDARPSGGELAGPSAIRTAVGELAKSFDKTWGGFGRAPKFPRPVTLELLLRYHRRTGDPQALAMVTRTLDRIAAGGIHDQIGGGFHRYSVDDKWRVPHFEKMLYDNAQLARLYLDAYQVTGDSDYAQTARTTLDYLLRELRGKDGTFYAAVDADSSGPHGIAEGAYYVWTTAEIDRVAGEDALAVRRVFDITVGGNFEHGTNVLWKPLPIDRAAADAIERVRPKLLAERAKRPAPAIDRKALVAWNALAISACARAALILDDARYREAAKTAATRILAVAHTGDTLRHAIVDGAPIGDGFLDDHAFLIAALLDLFEVDPDPAHLRSAIALQRELDARFAAPDGGYFFTSDKHEQLLVRDRADHDDAVPAGNSIAADNLLRLAELTSDDAYRTRALGVLRGAGATLTRAPGALPRMLGALDFALDKPKQIVIVTPTGGSPAPLVDRVRRAYVPNRVLVQVTEGDAAIEKLVPLVEGKRSKDGKPMAYVCVGTYCEQPTNDPDVLTKQLAQVHALP